MAEHGKFLLTEVAIKNYTDIKKGEVVHFQYQNEDRFVFVVDPLWDGKLHGLDLSHISRNDLLPLLQKAPKLSSKQLYESDLSTARFKKMEGYRTYLKEKMGPVRIVLYQSDVKAGKK